MRTTQQMGLILWDDFTNDQYDPNQLISNWLKINFHDHSPGRGTQISRGGLAAGAVGPNQLGSDIAWIPSENILAQRPSAGVFGRIFYATDTNQWFIDNGTIWEQFSGVNPLNLVGSPSYSGMTAGSNSLSISSGNQSSSALTVTHGLGLLPQFVFLTIGDYATGGQYPAGIWHNSITTTTFNVRCSLVANAGSNLTVPFNWMAIG